MLADDSDCNVKGIRRSTVEFGVSTRGLARVGRFVPGIAFDESVVDFKEMIRFTSSVVIVWKYPYKA